MIFATKTAVTVDELAKMPDGERTELDHGYLLERPTSPECAYIGVQIATNLTNYLRSNPIAVCFGDNCGYTLRADEDETLKKPDASVVLKSRLPSGAIPNTRFSFSPDLAIEVLSPSDNAYDVERKIGDYLDAGTQIVWLARPHSKRIVAYSKNGDEISYGPNDTITAEPLLPGFKMRVGDVFP